MRLKSDPGRLLTAATICGSLLYFAAGAHAQHEHVHEAASTASSFFGDFFKAYTPRRVCMFYEAPVIWLHVFSDALIALAYYSIPLALVHFVRHRRDVAFSGVFWLFALFILACGTTHAIGVVDIWVPFYRVDGVVKFITAIASVGTSVVMWHLMPQALSLPSAAMLEQTVKERTAELSKANESLRAREAQLAVQAAALEAAANGVIITDREGSIVWANPAFAKLTGYSLEEATGNNPRFLNSGRNDRAVYEDMWKTILSGQVWRGELINRRKDGSLYEEEISITPVRADDSGEITHFVGVKQDITERKKAEQALRDSEEQFRAFFENSAVGASQLDTQGRIVQANAPFCEQTGYSHEELIGKSILDICLPEDRENCEHIIGDLFTGHQESVHIEKRYLRKDGKIIWIDTTAGLIRDSKGRPWRSATLTQDITERKRTQEALQASVRSFRELADSMPQIVWASRPDGHVDYYNRKWYELTGAQESEHGDQSWLSVMHPEDRQSTMDIWYESVRTGKPYQTEYRYKFPASGEWRWHLGRALPVREQDGKIIRWYGTSTDVHDLRSAQLALHESEEHFRLALASSGTGWWHWDFRTNELDADERTKALVGLTPDLHLDFETVVQRAHPRDRERLRARARESRRRPGDYEVEFRAQKPDGSFRWLLLRGRSIAGAGENPVEAMGTAMDITDRKRLEEELRAATISATRAKELAETANAAKDHFLAVLSHELRTPLTPVLAAVSLIERKCEAGEISHSLEIIRRNVQLEARLIDDLLDLTRIVRGKIELEKKPLELSNVLHRVVEVCKLDLEARKVQLGFGLQDLPLTVNADNSRLQQIFWNLLKNAIKFTPDDGCIGIRAFRAGNSAVVEVVDSGIGIEQDALGRIFNAFEQADRMVTRQFGGLGLGLAISKRLVELHDGMIVAESAGKHQGATFRVTLPLHMEEAAPAQETKETVPMQATELRILLVEDHGDTAQLMTALLESQGYKVHSAGDLTQALQALDAGGFDLLISDLGLPDGNGIELMEEIRRRGMLLKGIALSGYGREEDVQRSKEAGFTEHLTKPVDFDVLTECVEKVASKFVTAAGE